MILVTLIAMMTAFAIIGLALSSYTTSQYSRTRTNVFIANATQVAEAGIENSLYQINQDETFAGFTTDQEFFNNATQGRAVYTTEVIPTADSNAKIVTSTAKIYRLSDLVKPVSIRKIKVTIVGTNSAGYSVYSGPGGLNISGNATITNTNVYVNGKINLSGTAGIGTNAQPVSVSVANIACPTGATPGPTYPTLCTTGEPISMTANTKIYGTVCATGQTSTGPNNNIQPGNGGEGLKPGCTAPAVSSITYDRAAHIAAVTTTGSANSSTYACSGSSSKTWPANLKLTGNVSISGNCNLRITGNVYVTGNLNITGGTITIDDALGATRPVIIVDGTVSVNGNTKLIANSSGIGMHLISFKSTGACSPNCTAVTGTDLKTSQDLQTVTVSGNANMPGVIYQAYWSKAVLSGTGNIGAAIGQTIDLSGNGTVIFGTILSSGNRSWSVTSYQQDFD
ncbi:MAG: hypothetical protein ACR2FM_02770 [Candidatus Saccharimonadales bacterium]